MLVGLVGVALTAGMVAFYVACVRGAVEVGPDEDSPGQEVDEAIALCMAEYAYTL